jgi:indolepyruvate ferredoxin oxidoreductase
LPDQVRGYEDVKLGNVAAYRTRQAQLLAKLDSPAYAPHP